MKKEYNILQYFNMRSLFIGIGISRILANAHELHPISVILGTLIGLIILKFIKIELKNNIVNTIISIVFLIYSFVIIVNLVSTMYLNHMMKFLLGIPIILLLMYILKCKEILIYRISNIMIVIVVFFFFFCLFCLLPNVEFSNLMYTNVSIKDVIISAIEYALISTVPTFIIRYKETSDIPIYKTYIASSITILLMMFVTYLILGPKLSELFRYPEYMVLKSINISGSLTNLENMLSLIWLIDAIMFIFCCGNTIKRQINNKVVLNIILVFILIVASIISKYYQLILSVYLYIIPILIISLISLYLVNKKSSS